MFIRIKNKIQRSRKNGFHFQNFIARINHVIDGIHHWQTCAHIGFSGHGVLHLRDVGCPITRWPGFTSARLTPRCSSGGFAFQGSNQPCSPALLQGCPPMRQVDPNRWQQRCWCRPARRPVKAARSCGHCNTTTAPCLRWTCWTPS